MRISDWSSDVCPSDLIVGTLGEAEMPVHLGRALQQVGEGVPAERECRGTADRRPQRIAPADRLVERQDASLVDSPLQDRKRGGSGTSVSVRVDLGGGGIIKKKNKCTTATTQK